MKLLVVFACLISLNSFARTTALEALQLALPENEYEGMDEFNEECIVDVIRGTAQTTVTLRNTDVTNFFVYENSPYTFNQSDESFSTTLVISSGPNTVELTFSTLRINQSQRLVTFNRVLRTPDGRQWASAQKCTIYN